MTDAGRPLREPPDPARRALSGFVKRHFCGTHRIPRGEAALSDRIGAAAAEGGVMALT
jgi:hypothetical protein